MTDLTDDELRIKILELDEQMGHLADILSKMLVKMDRIERATVDMEEAIREDMDEIMEDLNIAPQDRKT
jgi:hypothetical protein